MKKTPKRHHFVTRAYMNRFSDGSGHIYVLFKNKKGCHFVSKKPINVQNLCVENDFYTTFGVNMKKSVCVEQALARFEDEVPNSIFAQSPPNLLYPYINGGVVLNYIQKIKLVDAIAIQIIRGKAIREYGRSIIDESYRELLNETREKYKLRPELSMELDYLAQNEEQIKTNALAEGAIIELLKGGKNSKMRDNLQNRVCSILINTTELDFVTSDEPVLICSGIGKKIGIFNCPLENWDSIVYYPLDPKHLVVLYTKSFCGETDNNVGKIVLLGDEDKDFIRTINNAQYFQCNRYVMAQHVNSLEEIVSP